MGEITLFESERCIVRAKPEAEAAKTARRCRIALEAAKQCGRGIVPPVNPTCGFTEMLRSAAGCEKILFCYEGDNTVSLKSVLGGTGRAGCTRLALVVGPEGGFSPEEVAKARDAGAYTVNLGGRILRTETAAAFALGCLVYEFEL